MKQGSNLQGADIPVFWLLESSSMWLKSSSSIAKSSFVLVTRSSFLLIESTFSWWKRLKKPILLAQFLVYEHVRRWNPQKPIRSLLLSVCLNPSRRASHLPSGKLTVRYGSYGHLVPWFTHLKWWFSIALAVYQSVNGATPRSSILTIESSLINHPFFAWSNLAPQLWSLRWPPSSPLPAAPGRRRSWNTWWTQRMAPGQKWCDGFVEDTGFSNNGGTPKWMV